MENKRIKLAVQVVFYGSIWGILEATLGYTLHFVPTFIAGTIMFPIASVILLRAYNETKSKKALLFIGLVAASFKAVNLMMPTLNIYKTINPMISIVLEALLVVAVVTLFTSEKVKSKVAAAQIASIGWRLGVVAFMAVTMLITGFKADPLQNIMNGFMFVIASGVVSGLLTTGIGYVDNLVEYKQESRITTKPLFASILLVAALVFTIIL